MSMPSRWWKWMILFLSSMVTFGGYYSFDFPSVLHNQLYRHFHQRNMSITTTDYELSFSLLFSLYSFPNTVLPWFGGVLSDKIGNNTVMTVCAVLVLVGNMIQTYAIMSFNLTLMVFGRFVFGLGAETLQVCTNTTISKWFNGMELAFALGVNLSSCKLAGVLTDWVSPYVEKEGGIVMSSIVVTSLCFLCFIMTIILVITEPKTVGLKSSDNNKLVESLQTDERKMVPLRASPNSGSIGSPANSGQYYQILGFDGSASSATSIGAVVSFEGMKVGQRKRRSQTNGIYMNINDDSIHDRISDNLDEGDEIDPTVEHDVEMIDLYSSFHPLQSSFDSDNYDNCKTTNGKAVGDTVAVSCWREVKVVYHEMKRLSASVWIMMVFTFLMYGTFIPFSNISNAVIIEIFFANSTNLKKSEMTAAWYQSIPYFLTVFLNPPLGLMVDWFGNRTALLILSAVSLTCAHLLIYSAAVGAILPLLMIGIAYSIFGSVIWPCVPVVVEDSLHGTAYGTMAAFQNTGQFIMPLVLQQIFRVQHLFRPCELFLSSTAFAAVICGLVLYRVDKSYFDGILSKPSVSVEK